MVWILLFALGVPLWLVAGPSRPRSNCTLRAPRARRLLATTLRLQPACARRPHLHRGLALVHTTAYPGHRGEPAQAANEPAPPHLGDAPRIMPLTLDDGAIVETAVPTRRERHPRRRPPIPDKTTGTAHHRCSNRSALGDVPTVTTGLRPPCGKAARCSLDEKRRLNE